MPRDFPVITSSKEMQKLAIDLKSGGRKIAFVPTMGALHEGHLSLVSKANQIADHTIVSIFVNPTQFGENEDFDEYARDLEGDIEKLSAFNINAIFSPNVKEIYPDGFQTYVEVNELQKELCGRFRPGHFKGVATVVTKLFNIVLPDYAVFGKKDFQQLKIIERLVKDLDLDIEIVPMPIVRERDGLALSSRNVYLSDEDRKRAAFVSKALFAVSDSFKGGCVDAPELLRKGEKILREGGITDIDYLEIRDSENLQLIKTAGSGNLVAIAVRVGNTRLIDNTIL